MTHRGKTLAAAAAAAFMLTGMAEVAKAETRFIGGLIVTAKSGTCGNDPTGWRFQTRFAPANVGGNGTNSRLSLFSDRYAVGMTLVNGSFNNTLRGVKASDIYNGVFTFSGIKVSFLTQQPASILATSNSVDATGQIKGLFGGPLCVAAFSMSAARE